MGLPGLSWIAESTRPGVCHTANEDKQKTSNEQIQQFSPALAALICSSTAFADELKPIVPEAIALGRPVEFERDVYPILEANCIACHNVTVSEGDLILENIAGHSERRRNWTGGRSGKA